MLNGHRSFSNFYRLFYRTSLSISEPTDDTCTSVTLEKVILASESEVQIGHFNHTNPVLMGTFDRIRVNPRLGTNNIEIICTDIDDLYE